MQTLGAGDPRRIGPYVLTGRLGAGGMGSVYLGWDPAGRPAAVKVVRTDFLQDPDFRARFRREISSARRVSGPWISRVLDADPDADSPWLATEYVAGPTLDAAVTRFGPLPTQTVAVLAECLGQALAAVHAAGVVHRDIKPNNILLAADGPRLIDFGIARATDDTKLTATHAGVLGVAGFIAPERIESQAMLPAGDVFAGGVVLAYAATGKMAFGRGEPVTVAYRVVHGEPDLAELPEELRPLVTRCLAKAPGERPDAMQLADAGARLRGATDWPGVPITNDRDGSSTAGDTLELATSWLPRPLAMHTVRDYDLSAAHAAAETARLDFRRDPAHDPRVGGVGGFGADIGPGAGGNALTGNALNAAGFGDMAGHADSGGPQGPNSSQGPYGPQGPQGSNSTRPPRPRPGDTDQSPPQRRKPVALVGVGAAVVVAGLIAGGVALASGGESASTASQGSPSSQAAAQSSSAKDGGDLSPGGGSKPGDSLPTSGVPAAGSPPASSAAGAPAAPGGTSGGQVATSSAAHTSAASQPSASAHTTAQAPPPSSRSNSAPPPSTSQAPAPAPVPCGGTASTPQGTGVNCPFDTPGDGSSGGSPVVNGGTVGYLPSGTNWVICQAQGRTVTQGQYYNDWWAWTEANDKNWGWVNAVDASGGDNNGAFGGVPMCDGSKGAPPR